MVAELLLVTVLCPGRLLREHGLCVRTGEAEHLEHFFLRKTLICTLISQSTAAPRERFVPSKQRLRAFACLLTQHNGRTFRAAVRVPSTSKRAMMRGFLAGMVAVRVEKE